MANPIVEQLWKLLTGKPWTTTRSMAAEFGPTLASRYPELADYSDVELMRADLATLVEHIERIRSRHPDTAAAIERVTVGVLSGRIDVGQIKRVLEVTR